MWEAAWIAFSQAIRLGYTRWGLERRMPEGLERGRASQKGGGCHAQDTGTPHTLSRMRCLQDSKE
eukprot:2717091-Rhodomonas_salina.1